MSVRAKFQVATVEGNNVTMYPVCDGSDENKSFFASTPTGEIRLTTVNPEALKQFEPGAAYYVDFVKAVSALVMLLCFAALPAVAQTNTAQTNLLTLDLIQGPVVGIQNGLTKFLSLHDPTVQYFTNANTVEFEIGPSLHSSGGGVSQNLSIAGYHRIGATGEVGGNAEIETLTLGGQDISLAAAHIRYRKDWDNLAGFVGLGVVHNIAERQLGPELELGAEGGITDHLGWETRVDWMHDFLNNSRAQSIPLRVVAAMTYRF